MTRNVLRCLDGLLAVAALLVLASSSAAASAKSVAILVVPFDASSLSPDRQWMGNGIAQTISLGLATHPSFVQLKSRELSSMQAANDERLNQIARKLHARIVLFGSITQTRNEFLLLPVIFLVSDEGWTRVALPEIRTTETDFLARAATVPAIYARSLDVDLTPEQVTRIARAAKPTSSLRAFEFFVRGVNSLAQTSTETSLVLLSQAIQNDPDFAFAQYTLGVLQLTIGNRIRAGELFWLCLQLDRTMPEPYKALGDLFLGAPRPLIDSAIEVYSKAIDLRPFYAEAYLGLGNAKAAAHAVDDAAAAYRKVITLNPFIGTAYQKLARIYIQSGRCREASDLYKEAAALNLEANESKDRGCQEPLP